MILNLMFILMCVFCILQPPGRRAACIIFASPIILLDLIGPVGEGYYRFFGYALESLIPALMLYLLTSNSILVIRLQALCLIGALIQFAFFVAWDNYISHVAGWEIGYFYEYIALPSYYAVVIAVMCTKDEAQNGDFNSIPWLYRANFVNNRRASY